MMIKKQNYVLCVIVGNKTFKIIIFTLWLYVENSRGKISSIRKLFI